MTDIKRYYIVYSKFWECDVIRDSQRKAKFTGAHQMMPESLKCRTKNDLEKLCAELNTNQLTLPTR